jgi:nickel/cobalt exporter
VPKNTNRHNKLAFLLILGLFFFFFPLLNLFSQNPFIQAPSNAPILNPAPEGDSFLRWIQETSDTFQQSIAEYARKMQTEHWSYGLLAFLIAILFGIVHVAGPGHGKVFTITYFTSRNAKLREGILMSILINIVDSFSAFLVVGIGYFIINASIAQFTNNTSQILQIVSYGIILILSIIHGISHLRHDHSHHGHSHHDHDHANAQPHDHKHDHSHDDHDHHSDKITTDVKKKPKLKSWQLAASIGLIPCPVSTILLTYGIANNIFGFSIFLVIGVSLGGMITLSALALAIISGKKGLLALLKGDKATKVMEIFEWLSMGALTIIALFFFTSNLISVL